eukprot:g17.t1
MRDVTLSNKQALGEANVTKLQFFQEDEILFSYCKHPKILDYVEAIAGPNVKCIHNMLINKPPDRGQGTSKHPPHQDLWYFPFRPAKYITASWTAMQTIDKENGCLYVVPGTHKKDLLLHEYPPGINNRSYHGIQDFHRDPKKYEVKMKHVHMNVGDTIFFHPLLIHGSGPNTSDRFRKAISGHFVSSSNTDVYDTEGTLQAMIAKEVTEGVKRKTGMVMKHSELYVDILARFVRGDESKANW